MDFEKFYSDHVPKSCLPLENCGDLETIEVLHSKHQQMLEKMHEVFKAEETLFNIEFEQFAASKSDDDNFNDVLDIALG